MVLARCKHAFYADLDSNARTKAAPWVPRGPAVHTKIPWNLVPAKKMSSIIRMRIFLNARRSRREIRSSSGPQNTLNDHFSGLA